MTFNPDQARDAILVQDMLAGKVWPLMGPQAGNTHFSLGPIFYYFEFMAAKVFGPTADKMAYADLLFSIGAIGLSYLFFKKFFRERLSLALTFLFSISFFVVTYSRFAFNPNSIPFFTLLFLLSLISILDHAPREKLWWAAILGISMGVGFQLHTLLFLALPFIALCVFGYLLFRRHFFWKSFLLTLFFFFIANSGQLLSEYRTGGANMRSFFSEADSSTGGLGRNIGRDMSDDILCHIQGYTYIISSLGSGDKCNLPGLESRIRKKGIAFTWERIAVGLFGAIFTIGGFILFVSASRKETDRKRKHALVVTGAYAFSIFAILLSVSSSISIRYFIVVEFMPFLFLGFWMRFIQRKVPHLPVSTTLGIVVMIFAGLNLWTTTQAVMAYRNGTASTDNVAAYGEVEDMSRYILERSGGSKQIYLAGKRAYLSRYGKPIEYFGRQQGVVISKAHKPEKMIVNAPFFYVTKRVSAKNSLPSVIDTFETEQSKNFGNISILQLIRKGE
jgi:hypothetical protein